MKELNKDTAERFDKCFESSRIGLEEVYKEVTSNDGWGEAHMNRIKQFIAQEIELAEKRLGEKVLSTIGSTVEAYHHEDEVVKRTIAHEIYQLVKDSLINENGNPR